MNLRNNIITGKKGEQIASTYLLSLGYKIIDSNWHYSKNAEIDIIAQDRDTLVFIEVKTRKTLNYGHPFEAISANKLKKLNMALLAYLSKCEKKYKDYRIDSIAIIGTINPQIEHIKNLGQY